MPDSRTGELCAVYIDMGTTNTRAWLAIGDRVIAQGTRVVGVRDTARSGSADVLRAALRELIVQVQEEAATRETAHAPKCVAAAGMITSSLGLTEVPHVTPPTGVAELARSAKWKDFPQIGDLPFLLVPGVRSGPLQGNVSSIGSTDVMRGEETLCVGLVASRQVQAPATVMNLGSHWKAIVLDQQGRVGSSVTSLSGELIHALQSQTILADSILSTRPARLDTEWLEAGMREQRRSGLPRALFCGRLLDLARQGDADLRLAYVIGAVIAADLDALVDCGILSAKMSVSLVGSAALAEAWRHACSQKGIMATPISEEDSERALLAGLRTILSEALGMPTSNSASKGQA